jgi:calcium-translocating P-type ATPase
MADGSSLAISPFLTGDPVSLGPGIGSPGDVLAQLGLSLDEPAGCLHVAPGIALLHALVSGPGSVTLHWVNLPHRPALGGGLPPVEAALILLAPVGDSARALRLVGRVMAVLAEPEVAARARAATTRESLVEALAPAERAAGEMSLGNPELLGLLASSPRGLDAAEAGRRLLACGPNRLERVRRRALGLRFLEQFWSFFAVLLWVAGIFAVLAGMAELGWAIFTVIVINGVFSFLQEYRAERAIEALQEMFPATITAVRGGQEQRLAATLLVPGDIVQVGEGDQVPADGQLLSALGLRVDQSALTGESHPVFKLPAAGNNRARVPLRERPELVFAGTAVVAGSGHVVVRATGMQTEIGIIARLTQAVPEAPSPLQREMARVTRIVSVLATAVGAGFFALGVTTRVLPTTEGFFFALGVIVANVPEGLLPTLTLALALGAQRMVRQKCLVKRLSAIETLGATTVICTDKTGTLTENRMTARSVWTGGRVLAASSLDVERTPGLQELFEAAALASQATAEHGDPTEVALVAAGARLGVDPDKLREAHGLLAPYPFDSFRKRMTLVRRARDGAVAYVKGAPKEMLALCDTIYWDGRALPLDDEGRRAVLTDHDRLAGEGLRILAVARRSLPDALVGAGVSVVERQLTFLGLIALWDPPRPEVEEAVALCRRAGIRVVMVTGDYGLTAKAIAAQIGLPASKVISGDEVDRLPPDALRQLLTEPGVLFARTSPAHKLAIVSALHAAGEVVAVTGDGVNDAPALKAATIGVAMGRRGSEVAKEAAVMVITDDNFASIVAGVRQGRAIYANMGKFVTYIFASNVPELLPFLALVFFRIPLALTVMQILAVDLGTDLLPALALGAEPAEPDVMDRPPRARSDRLLGARRLLHAYAFLGLAEAALSLCAFFWTFWLAGWRPGLPMAETGSLYRRATTMTFSGIVAAQVGNLFACRTERESLLRARLFSNPHVWGGIAAELALLLALVLVPPLADVFGLAPLAFAEWSILLAFPPAMLALEEGRKWLVRRSHRERPGR